MNNLLNSYIHLTDGPDRVFPFGGFTAGDICLKDIALALSRQVRFNGLSSITGRRPLTVAQHCLILKDMMITWEEKVWALLHDAAETYIGDIPHPLKNHLYLHLQTLEQKEVGATMELMSIRQFEEKVLMAVAEQFDLPWPIPPNVLTWDRDLGEMELAYLTDKNEKLPTPGGLIAVLDDHEIRECFLEDVNSLFITRNRSGPPVGKSDVLAWKDSPVRVDPSQTGTETVGG